MAYVISLLICLCVNRESEGEWASTMSNYYVINTAAVSLSGIEIYKSRIFLKFHNRILLSKEAVMIIFSLLFISTVRILLS